MKKHFVYRYPVKVCSFSLENIGVKSKMVILRV